MAVYKLAPDFARALRRRVLTVTIPLNLIIVAVGLGIAVVRVGSFAGLWIAFPVLIAVLSVSLYRGYRRQISQVGSFELALAPDHVTRTVAAFPPLTLRRDEILRISEHASGELTLHVQDPRRALRIPSQIERRNELRAELATWQAIEPAGKLHTRFWSLAASVLVVIAFVVTWTSSQVWIVATVGSALVLALLVSAFLIWRNRQGNAKTRRLAFFVLLPALAIAVQVITALRGR
jgi:hypothetical protein